MRGWMRDDTRPVEVISGCYLMTRREVVEQVGLLDDDFFFFGEEADWCRRVAVAGWKLMFSPVGEIVHFGGGSVRRLNHKRDLMLTEASVRLHLKHSGLFAASICFALLFCFNLSRACLWSLAALAAPRASAVGRRDHFLGVVRNYRQAWPSKPNQAAMEITSPVELT